MARLTLYYPHVLIVVAGLKRLVFGEDAFTEAGLSIFAAHELFIS
jgi:hypothetical protein